MNLNKREFTNYLESPGCLTRESAGILSALLKEFPYCQAAQLLYLKNLHLTNNIQYPKQLKIAAAYANDRKKLYQLVMQEDLQQKIVILDEDTGAAEKQEGDKVSELEMQILQEAVNASIKLEVSGGTGAGEKTAPEILAAKPVPARHSEAKAWSLPEEVMQEADKRSPRNFTQWLKVIGSADPDRSQIDAAPSDDLLEKFIREHPEKPKTSKAGAGHPFFSPIDTARLSLVDDESFVTETLADIYAKQGYFAKALKAYQVLKSKYPEKNSIFAAKIKTVEGLLRKP